MFHSNSASQVFIEGCKLIDTISFILDSHDTDVSFNFQICDSVVDYHLVFTHTNTDSHVAQISVSVEDVTGIDGIENQRRGLITLTNVPAGEFSTNERLKIYQLSNGQGDVEMSLFINSSTPSHDGQSMRFVNISLWHRWGH